MPQFLKLLKFFLLINASLHIKKEDLSNIKNLYLCCFVMMHLTFSLPSTYSYFSSSYTTYFYFHRYSPSLYRQFLN